MYVVIFAGHDVVARRRRRRSRARGADGVGLQHVVQKEPRQDSGRVLSARARTLLDANPPTTSNQYLFNP